MKKTLLTLGLSVVLAATLSAKDSLMMATTTSTDNTGLLDYLAPLFRKRYWYYIKMGCNRNRESY